MSAPTASASASSTSVGRFAGQIVLIAGGSQNLGRELAVAFAAAGARLSIFARTESELRETKKQCMQASKSTDEKESVSTRTHARARSFSCRGPILLVLFVRVFSVLISVGDISIASDVARIVAATVSAFGRIDISINNACYDSQPNDTADVEPSEFAKVMDIGVNGQTRTHAHARAHEAKRRARTVSPPCEGCFWTENRRRRRRLHRCSLPGTFHCMKYVIAAMLQQSASSSSTPDVSPAASSDLSPICVSSASRGIIINVASRYGHVAFPRWGPYCAAKHAVIGLTKTAAIEYATKGQFHRERTRHCWAWLLRATSIWNERHRASCAHDRLVCACARSFSLFSSFLLASG